MEVVLGILFRFFDNTNIEFAELGKLTWRSYIVAETLSTTSYIELNDKKEFAKIALDKNSKTFVIHISTPKDYQRYASFLGNIDFRLIVG